MTITIELDSRWLRLEFFLPVNTPREIRAFQYIIARLTEQYGGSTHSVVHPPIFRGWYEDKESKTLIPDSIAMLIVFLQGDLEKDIMEKRCKRIMMMVDGQYKRAGSRQLDIWMLTNTNNNFSLKNQ